MLHGQETTQLGIDMVCLPQSKNNKYLNILLFVISIPLGLLINYYITSEWVRRLNYSSVYVYMVVALLQVIII